MVEKNLAGRYRVGELSITDKEMKGV